MNKLVGICWFIAVQCVYMEDREPLYTFQQPEFMLYSAMTMQIHAIWLISELISNGGEQWHFPYRFHDNRAEFWHHVTMNSLQWLLWLLLRLVPFLCPDAVRTKVYTNCSSIILLANQTKVYTNSSSIMLLANQQISLKMYTLYICVISLMWLRTIL